MNANMDKILDGLLTIEDVIRVTSLGRSTVFAYVAAGKFPKPVKITGRRIRWKKDDVSGWLKDKIGEDAASTTEEVNKTGCVTAYQIGLRDYFAAKAMQGFAADPSLSISTHDRIAEEAYKWADAMLKAREA